MTRDEEHAEQSILFQRLALDPRTRDALIYAVPNFPGHVGGRVARLRTGARAKAEGRKKGAPDVNVDEARGKFHGLRIEMKSRTGRVSPEQKAWHQRLAERGYLAQVCRSADEAFACVLSYLEWPNP